MDIKIENIPPDLYKTIQELGSDWTMNSSLSDEDIKALSSFITSQPVSFFDNSTDAPLFSLEQMIGMFRLGYDLKRYLGYKKRGDKRRKTKTGKSTCFKVRQLNPKEELSLPISEYGAARAAAHLYKKNFGAEYRVFKKSEEEVIVIRIK